MNRYMIAGILADMRAGRKVLLLCETPGATREAFENLAACAQPGEAVVRTVGMERIQAYGAGAIRFRTVNSHPGTIDADVVVVDADARRHADAVERLWFHFARRGKSVEVIEH